MNAFSEKVVTESVLVVDLDGSLIYTDMRHESAVRLLGGHPLAVLEFSNPDAWLSLLLAFLAFSICASSVYVVSDLPDLENDRQHLRKKSRSFSPSSDRVSPATGMVFGAILLAGMVGLPSLS